MRAADCRAAPGLSSPSASGAERLADGSERIWSGVLPCSDCAGVDTRLVLRIEGTRVIDGESLASYTLDPGVGAQVFVLRPDGALELLDADGRPSAQAVDYRLQRL